MSPYGELTVNPNHNNVVVFVTEISMHFTASKHVQVYKLDSEMLIVGLNHCSSNTLWYKCKQHDRALDWYSLLSSELIDWFFIWLMSLSKIFYSYGDVIIAGEGVQSAYAQYSGTMVLPQMLCHDPGSDFSGLIRTCLLWCTRECRRPTMQLRLKQDYGVLWQ
jgi:hypothetical protein